MRTDTLLIELGTEELPPKSLKSLATAFAANMQKEIDDKLAQALLGGAIHDGDTVRVDLLEDRSGLVVEPFSLD